VSRGDGTGFHDTVAFPEPATRTIPDGTVAAIVVSTIATAIRLNASAFAATFA
jgi:hypothetical protein